MCTLENPCNRFEKGVPFDKSKHCRKCWLFHNSEKHRIAWSKPNILQKATNFIEAVATQALAGFPTVSDSQYQERLKICESCEFCKNWKCERCGCSLTLKAKWATQSCPIGKWEATPKNRCGCKSD